MGRDQVYRMPATGPQTIKAVDNAFTVAQALKELDGAGVSELARHIDASKSTVHSHLKTLEKLQFVVKRGDTYYLGTRWLDMGGYVRKQQRLYWTAKTEADELAASTGELVAITTLEYGRSVYLYQTRGRKALTIDSHVGVRLPLYCTAAGKAILAHLPDDEVERLVEETEMEAKTEKTITDLSRLHEELDRIRDSGVALEDGERIEGTRGIGAPILDQTSGEVLGAIAICGPPTRLHGETFTDELSKLVRQTAKVIEVNVTFSE